MTSQQGSLSNNVGERVSWSEYFMNIAQVVKTRSLDTKTQVGAVFNKYRCKTSIKILKWCVNYVIISKLI